MMKTHRFHLFTLPVAALLLCLAVACGGEDDDEAEEECIKRRQADCERCIDACSSCNDPLASCTVSCTRSCP